MCLNIFLVVTYDIRLRNGEIVRPRAPTQASDTWNACCNVCTKENGFASFKVLVIKSRLLCFNIVNNIRKNTEKSFLKSNNSIDVTEVTLY